MSAELRRWLPFHRASPDARLRLFCFHPAGAGATLFRTWAGALGPDVDVCAVQLPGRESRLRDTPFRSMDAVADAVVAALGDYFTEHPFAFFGHSMGATVAHAVVCKLRQVGGPLPTHLVVSGSRGPTVPRREQLFGDASDEVLIEVMRELGGTPAEVFEHPELLSVLLPTLQADFAVLESPRPAHEPVPVPITALAGKDDTWAQPEDAAAWAIETSVGCSHHVLPGDHFFVTSAREEVLSIVSEALLKGSGHPR